MLHTLLIIYILIAAVFLIGTALGVCIALAGNRGRERAAAQRGSIDIHLVREVPETTSSALPAQNEKPNALAA